MNINQIARTQTNDPSILNESYLVDPQRSAYHPHVYTVLTELPKSFHPNKPTALVEFEYIGEGPNSYSAPNSQDSINVLRIVVEGYKNVSPSTLPQNVLDDIKGIGFKHLDSEDDSAIDNASTEHFIW